MSDLSYALQRLRDDFTISTEKLRSISTSFLREMTEGLAGRPSSLAMLPSYLTQPSGQETGTFLALDFGGTNVRALSVKLLGEGRFQILARQSLPLVDPASNYNFISEAARAEDLFDFLACQLAKLTDSNTVYLLGHCFSFACQQSGANNATLLYWTKEIKTQGVEGHDVVQLLNDAFARQGLAHIRPVVIVNDSVSALIAAAYNDTKTDIGSICGTGHNTCYLEPHSPWASTPMFINMESGSFDKLSGNVFDIALDKNSERPGAGRLEKMCSGRYIGEIFRLAVSDLIEQRLLFGGYSPVLFASTDILTGEDLAIILNDTASDLDSIGEWLDLRDPQLAHTYSDRAALQEIAGLVTKRSARLVAATFVGVLNHIDPHCNRNHTIAIDGSLYEKMPGYAQTIRETLDELLDDSAHKISLTLTKDGSGVGAAIAAATTVSGGQGPGARD
jgi:hexokinase